MLSYESQGGMAGIGVVFKRPDGNRELVVAAISDSMVALGGHKVGLLP
jgi:hypothetical protein